MTTPSDPNRTRASIFIRLNDAALRELTWQEFHDRYAPMIGGFARRLGARTDEAADVVQEVLLDFFVASRTFEYDPSRKFRGFLKCCTFRKLRKLVRKGRIGGKPVKEIDEADAQVDHAWDDVWERELLKQAFEKARVRYRDNITFKAFARIVVDGQSVEDVAAALGMSKDAAYKAKQRVAVAVREELDLLRQEIG